MREQDIRTGVISNIGWTGAALQRRINTLLPENHFEFILASSEYGLRKPDPRLFQVALEKAALKPEDVWFCGDTYDKDIEGARSMGIFPVFYRGQASANALRPPVPGESDANTPGIYDWNMLIEMLKHM